MTRKIWVVVAFGLGVALAPLVHQLGTVCLHPAAAIAEDRTVPGPFEPASNQASPSTKKVEDPQPSDNKPGQKSPGAGGSTANSAESFLELSKQKAALLTPEEMTREVERLDTELNELRAGIQLREAVGKLKQLTVLYPNSQAAKRATKMLEAETAPTGGIEFNPSLRESDPFSAPERAKPQLAPKNSLPTY